MFFRWVSFACHSTLCEFLRSTRCTLDFMHTKNTIVHETMARSELYIYSFQNSCWLRVKNIYLRFIFTFSSRSLSPLCRRQALVVVVVVVEGAWALKPSQTEHNFRWFKHLRVAQLIWHLCTGARLRKKENNNEKKRENTNTLSHSTAQTKPAERTDNNETEQSIYGVQYRECGMTDAGALGVAKTFEIYISIIL